MPFRDRIQELRRVPARLLKPHPKNWRRHPRGQRQALESALAEIGYAGALLARELSDGTLELIDGHLRAEITPDAEVPVLVVDLSEREADQLLAVYDPLTAMAEQDDTKLAALIEQIEARSESRRQLLHRLARADEPVPIRKPERPRREIQLAESYQLVVDCRDEADQRAMYERLTSEGYACRVLTI